MDKNRRWVHSADVLKSGEDSSHTASPVSSHRVGRWHEAMPNVSYIDIVNYLVFSEGVDGGELSSYKSTEAYNYLHSNTIRKVLLKKHSEFIFLKAAVEPSQSVNQAKHTAWIRFLKKTYIFMNCCGNQQRHMLYISSFKKQFSIYDMMLCPLSPALLERQQAPSCGISGGTPDAAARCR